MAAFSFEIVEHGNPVLLEPLTCKKPALELQTMPPKSSGMRRTQPMA